METERKQWLQLKSLKSAGAEDNTNVIYQRLELNVDPAYDSISGEVTTYFIPNTGITFLEFDLSDTLSVDSIVYHHQLISYTHGGDIIHINLPATITAGTHDSVSIYYQGKPGSNGFGSFVQSNHLGTPIIWTLSEPYGAKDWWPCKQNLYDKIDSLDVIVTTPDVYRAASNGLLVEEIQSGNNKIYHWKHRYPIATYLVCMAVTNYVAYYHYVPFGNDTVPVLNYVYPEDTGVLKPQTVQIIGMMQLYDSLFGPYPFSKEKYGQVEFGWGGGMEHQTMTFMGDFGFETLAHELAHHWFGDKVTCASWQNIWLNEGFAVYLSGLCYEHIAPFYWTSFKQTRIGGAVADPFGELYCTDTTDVARIFDGHVTYAKGGMVLHMLRWKLGDSLFFAGIRSYLNDTANAYSFANTEDLKNHLMLISGQDLNSFFSEWVYGKGFPSYKVSWSQDFNKHVTLNLGQTQSDPSVSFFELPVAIKFKGFGGDSTMVFNHAHSGQSFSFDLPYVIDTVIFDPDYWLISANNVVTRASAYDFALKIFPNPVGKVLQLHVQSAKSLQAQVKVFNDLGQVKYGVTYQLQSGENDININVSAFASGVYHAEISIPDREITSSFEVIGVK